VNVLDREVLLWLNQFARTSRAFDGSVAWLAGSNALKGGVLTVVLLWFWFGDSRGRARHREVILATVAAAAVALGVGRLLATALPFRVRPVHDPSLGFVAPYGYPEGLLRTWSAFPSDHAMLFAAMATGLLLISRRVGMFAFLYLGLAILAPRVYLGMHHPTDVLFGAALGVAFALAANARPVRERLARLPLRWAEAHPRSFHAAGFVAAMQLATMFDGPREVAREVRALLRADAPAGELAMAAGCVADPVGRQPDARALAAAAAAKPQGVTMVPAPVSAPRSARPIGAAMR
jgi:undecaprenyl-diphosphatase